MLGQMSSRCPHCGALLHSSSSPDLVETTPTTCWMCTRPIPSTESFHGVSAPTIMLGQLKRQKKTAPIGVARDSSATPLELPSGEEVKISVLGGASQGMEFDVLRPLMTIGRLHGGADIEIDDPEVSRSHCAVEVRRNTILLHDLKSTNGTYIGDSRIFATQLQPMSIFRIGNSTLQVKIVVKQQENALISGRPVKP